MLSNIETLIRRFFPSLPDPASNLYNEASLQHELAVFLRQHLPDGWCLYFERPAASFRPAATRLVKKEIDLALTDPTGDTVIAVELKCPRQGQHPEQMFKACQDLLFLEQLVAAGFAGGVFVMHVRDPLFYASGSREGIYAHFRAGTPIRGTIQKPTGARDLTVCLEGAYTPGWIADAGDGRFWIQPIGPRGHSHQVSRSDEDGTDAGPGY